MDSRVNINHLDGVIQASHKPVLAQLQPDNHRPPGQSAANRFRYNQITGL